MEIVPIDDAPVECLMLKLSRLPNASVNFPSVCYLLNVYIPSAPLAFDYSSLQSFFGAPVYDSSLLGTDVNLR